MIIGENKPMHKKSHSLFPVRQALLNCSNSGVGHFPTNLCVNLSNFVATDVYAFLCWTFPHKSTNQFVEFSRDTHLRILEPGSFSQIYALFVKVS